MERVVYILGAGFTAPLGLPVMRDFLRKSRDLYEYHPDDCAFFPDVFKQIEWLGKIKSYYNSDLLDIEEILAIFDLNSYLSGRRKQQFQEYIRTVIALTTPPVSDAVHDPEEILGDTWKKNIFNCGDILALYAYFLLGIQNMIVRPEYFFTLDIHRKNLSLRRNPERQASYALITVNYDLVLENICGYISGNMLINNPFSFFKTSPSGDIWETPAFARLHGCINTSILPPMLNMPLSTDIMNAWFLADKALKEATRIRVIGYSLSGADSHLKSLIQTALSESPHLKQVDVLCKDDDLGTVEGRYQELSGDGRVSFVDGDVADYLKLAYDVHAQNRLRNRDDLYFDRLEQAHAGFFGR